MPDQETQADCDVMSLSDEHKRFEPFVGTFSAEVKMWMGPGDPMVSTGRMVNELDLGGRFLRQDYVGDPNEGPFPNFAGRGFWGYNTVDQCYEGVWVDNATTMMQAEKGHVDGSGKVWTMECVMTDPQSGQPMKKRSVVTLIDNDHHTMEMFFDKPGAGEFKCMEIRYTRA